MPQRKHTMFLCALLTALVLLVMPSVVLAEESSTTVNKVEVPTVDKTVSVDGETFSDTVDASVGDALYYRVFGTLPAYTYSMKDDSILCEYGFVDKADEHIKYDESTIKIELVNETETVDVTSKFDISVKDGQIYADCKDVKHIHSWIDMNANLVLSYKAQFIDVDGLGFSSPYENSCHVFYSVSDDKTEETPDDVTFVYSFGLNVFKYSGEDFTPLPGAKFALQNKAGLWFTGKGFSKNEADKFVYTSDSKGQLQFDGIGAGEYILHEISAPDGYQVVSPVTISLKCDYSDKKPKLEVSASGDVLDSVDSAKGIVHVKLDDPKDSDKNSNSSNSSDDKPLSSNPNTSTASGNKSNTSTSNPNVSSDGGSSGTSGPLSVTGDTTNSTVAFVFAGLSIILCGIGFYLHGRRDVE